MRTPHRSRAFGPVRRTALATALALAFGATESAAQTPTDRIVTNTSELISAINAFNSEFSSSAIPNCNGSSISLEGGPFVVTGSTPLPSLACPGLTVRTPASWPYGGQISASNTFGLCGLSADEVANVDRVEIFGFTYGTALCGTFGSITNTSLHDNDTGFGGGSVDSFVENDVSFNRIGAAGTFGSAKLNRIHDNTYIGLLVQSGPRSNIGGARGIDSNYFYGNSWADVEVPYGGSADILGNYIGSDDGSAQGTAYNGIYVEGDAKIDGNVISAYQYGVMMYGGGTVTNNLVGVDASGTQGLGGNAGVYVSFNAGPVEISGNTIAGTQVSVVLDNASSVQVRNNNLGASATGTQLSSSAEFPFAGVIVGCSSAVQITGNVIGNQAFGGVMVAGSGSTTIDSNFIGTTSNGVTPLENLGYGILLEGNSCIPESPQQLSGGSGPKRRALARSAAARVFTSVAGTTIHNNTIANNGQGGVVIEYGGASSDNLIEGNHIAFNTNSGVAILDPSSKNNAIVGNSIHDNSPKNIDLNWASPGTPLANDPGDVPTGANDGLNYPEILSVVQDGTNTTVTYRMDTRTDAPHDYVVEFFTNPTGTTQPSGTTPQRLVLKSGVQGVATFTETLPGTLDNFSLTATLSNGASGWIETSELSPVAQAVYVPPALTLLPASLNFGSVPVGEESGSQSVVLSNVSDSDVNLTPPTASGPFRIVTTSCLNVLTAHTSCSIETRFVPAHGGNASGAVTLTAGGMTYSASLAGTGLDVALLDVPSLVDFGSYTVGTPPLTRTVTLKSNGTGVVTIDDISVSGPFTLSHDCPLNLAPGSSCTLTLEFAPGEMGSATGQVTIRSNSVGSSTISLKAVAMAVAAPLVNVSPSEISFGNRLIGSASASVRVMVRNSGGASAVLGPFTTSPDFFVLGTTCGATLEPQATCTADVAMRPIGFGPRPGRLTFTSNAQGSPHIVVLGGAGCRPFPAGGNRGGSGDNCAP
jgi:hypothetical protein